MHIDPTTHEHGASAKVYTYEGDYEVEEARIRWQASVSHDETQRDLHAIVKAQHEATAQWAASPPEGLDAEPGGWSVAAPLTPADLHNVTPLPRRRRDDG